MNKTAKIFFYGFLTWFIPFIFSFFFVDQNGNFLIAETFFKSIMVVTGALVGAFFAVKYFMGIKADYVKEGLFIGLAWLAINLCLDLAMVSGGFFKMSVASYFTDIGIRYLAIPIYTVGMAYALKQK